MTFAGSPDRVESRLVPEAGFELDHFAISGFPRRPSLALVKALWRAVRAPFACLRILRARRPDVVLGGGGYVAGPMVLAARLRGIPAALTEADAHLGLANRLAAPFARRVFLAYDVPGRTGARYEVVGRPIPVAHRGATRAEGRARFGLPAAGHVVAVFGALAGARSLNEMAVDAWGAQGPAVLHICGERDYRRPARARLPAGIRARPADRPLRRGAGRSRPRRLAGRRHRVGARRGRHARRARPLPVRHGRPPDAERAPLRAGGRRGRRPGRRGRAASPLSSTGSSPTRPGSSACARRCWRWRGPTRPT